MGKQVTFDPFSDLPPNADDWFNGGTWELTKGDDFNIAPETMRTKVRDRWHRKYGELNVAIDGPHVYIRHQPGYASSGAGDSSRDVLEIAAGLISSYGDSELADRVLECLVRMDDTQYLAQ